MSLWKIGQNEPIAELTIPGELPNRHAMAYTPSTNLFACGNRTEKEDESWDENDLENGAVYVWDVTSDSFNTSSEESIRILSIT